MAYRIELLQSLRVAGQLYHTGIYRVPRDLPEAIAERALANGSARKIDPPAKPKVEPQATRGFRRKGPAPENKIQSVAENKSDAGDDKARLV